MDGLLMEVADDEFVLGMQYICSAGRLDTEAREQDEVTAGRLRRLAGEFRRRAMTLMTPELV